MALSTVTKSYLDSHFGPGTAAMIVNAINNQTTVGWTLDSRGRLDFHGEGESQAFKTAVCGSGTLSVAAMNQLENILGGRGNAEELNTIVAAGTGA